MSSELVQKDRDAVDRPAALKMRLDLLRARTVVDIADEDTPRINVLLALAKMLGL